MPARKIDPYSAENPEAHYPLVTKIAMPFRNRSSADLSDLVQEGMLGVLHAARKYDPDRGVKFSSYASFWIRAYIWKFIEGHRNLVKMNTTQKHRQLLLHSNRAYRSLPADATYSELAEETSKELDIPEETVRTFFLHMAGNVSLDRLLPGAEDTRYIDALPSPGGVEAIETSDLPELYGNTVEALLQQLTPREQDIIHRRFLQEEPETLEHISRSYGCTRERIRQIEAKALKKMREEVLEWEHSRELQEALKAS